MEKEQPPIIIKPLTECTFEQGAALWNEGFRHYYSDMTKDVKAYVQHLGTNGVDPTLSVAAFAGQEPAGFVLIAVRNVNGKRIAWNGGTGVNPKFRGMGIAKTLMREAVNGIRSAGMDEALLEVVSSNAGAINVYEAYGFRSVDDLIGMKRSGRFGAANPFGCTTGSDTATGSRYAGTFAKPADTAKLPFYRRRSAWTSQWFNRPDADALLITDTGSDVPVGYAIFKRGYTDSGELASIVLYQVEADPSRADAGDITCFALSRVFPPAEADIVRVTDNLRATNEHAVRALKLAGFETVYEQKLMWLSF